MFLLLISIDVNSLMTAVKVNHFYLHLYLIRLFSPLILIFESMPRVLAHDCNWQIKTT